jgi:hypothetical protein
MALINTTTPFGFRGLQTGLQFATGQDNLFDAGEVVRQSLIRDTEFNLANQLLGQGFSTPEVAAAIGQSSPFLDRGLSRLSSAVSAQQALAPSAIAAAQQGNFNPINRLQGFFGDVGNFNARNFNTTATLPLIGSQGLAAQLGVQQNAFSNNILQRQLALQQAQLQASNQGGTQRRDGFGDSGNSSFGNLLNFGSNNGSFDANQFNAGITNFRF